MKKTVKDVFEKKSKGKVVMITAYDAIFARLADAADPEILLVGDSLGNTFLGFENTVGVTLDAMVHHTAAVARAKPNALIASDLPFASAHYNADKLLEASARLVQEGGADAVKIEGGKEMAPKIKILTDAGIPVVGHIGLQPQQVLILGGYKKFGKTEEEKKSLIEDALALEKAGVFCIVLEMVDENAAAEVTKATKVPIVGIGAGKDCDGQVLVCTDILGLSENAPKFAKKYADLRGESLKAFKSFADDVRAGL